MTTRPTEQQKTTLSVPERAHFRRVVRDYFAIHGRHHLPWRQTDDPYAILVSEVMLQQTQVDRVIPKYDTWLTAFPTFKALAKASTRSVLTHWQGLGYNRRALALKRLAEEVCENYDEHLPQDFEALKQLPGIGPYTASAVLAFAFNVPTTMIETNIRAVYLHHFFKQQQDVSDVELLPLIADTCDQKNPRDWYAALMDYGAHLKKEVANPSRQSKHHTKQSRFANSDRQLRGAIVCHLTRQPRLTVAVLNKELPFSQKRIAAQVTQLEAEGFIERQGNTIRLAH